MTYRSAGAAAALALMLAPVAAQATDYRVMGEDERAISVIEEAVKTDSDGHRETGFFIGFSEPVGGPGGTQVIASTLLFDCPANRYKVGASRSFTADMAPVQQTDGHYGWRNLVADSPFARAAAFACKGEALPKADGASVKAVVGAYLVRRAEAAAAVDAKAAAQPDPAPATDATPPADPVPEPDAAPDSSPETSAEPELPADPPSEP
jgi:hypothetical protein